MVSWRLKRQCEQIQGRYHSMWPVVLLTILNLTTFSTFAVDVTTDEGTTTSSPVQTTLGETTNVEENVKEAMNCVVSKCDEQTFLVLVSCAAGLSALCCLTALSLGCLCIRALSVRKSGNRRRPRGQEGKMTKITILVNQHKRPSSQPPRVVLKTKKTNRATETSTRPYRDDSRKIDNERTQSPKTTSLRSLFTSDGPDQNMSEDLPSTPEMQVTHKKCVSDDDSPLNSPLNSPLKSIVKAFQRNQPPL